MDATSAACSDKGHVRPNNEDSYGIDDDLSVYVVCDGMGGHAGGEIASSMAVQVCRRVATAHADTIRAVQAGELEDEQLMPIAQEAVERACADIHAAAQSGDVELQGMGCTMTVVILGDRRAAMAHVGDTRLYLVRAARTHQLSVDHTFAAELARLGSIRWDDVPGHRMSHTLLRSVGTQPSVQVDTLLFDIAAGDDLVLCSDGLTAHLDDPKELSDELDVATVSAAAEALVGRALEGGGEDNVTVVVVRLDGRRAIPEMPEHVEELDAMLACYLFEGTSLATRTRILNLCEIDAFAEGTTVLAKGVNADVLMIVIRGRLEAEPGGQVFEESAVLGETLVLEGRKSRARVRAATDARVVTLSSERLRLLTHLHPWLGVKILERMALRIARSWLDGEPVPC